MLRAIREGYEALPERLRTPLILSLENHCTVPQQRKVARCFVDGFGELLARPPAGRRPADPPADMISRQQQQID